MAEHFELLIRGGTLVDGSGAPGQPGELGIRDGRIAAIGAPLELGDDAVQSFRPASSTFIPTTTHRSSGTRC
jgi:N-acyl-D-amino-acid deacylase